MAGDNSIVTELFLKDNFSDWCYGVSGTNNTLALSCDDILENYDLSIVGITSSGDRCPAQNQIIYLDEPTFEVFLYNKAKQTQINDRNYLVSVYENRILTTDNTSFGTPSYPEIGFVRTRWAVIIPFLDYNCIATRMLLEYDMRYTYLGNDYYIYSGSVYIAKGTNNGYSRQFDISYMLGDDGYSILDTDFYKCYSAYGSSIELDGNISETYAINQETIDLLNTKVTDYLNNPADYNASIVTLAIREIKDDLGSGPTEPYDSLGVGITQLSFSLSYHLKRPVVLTEADQIIYTTSATLTGNVTHAGLNGITERGICYKLYSSSGTPTTSDSTIAAVYPAGGSYDLTLNSLASGTKYKYRAYAINGTATVYGIERDFTTT